VLGRVSSIVHCRLHKRSHRRPLAAAFNNRGLAFQSTRHLDRALPISTASFLLPLNATGHNNRALCGWQANFAAAIKDTMKPSAAAGTGAPKQPRRGAPLLGDLIALVRIT